jgi:myo-inositol-1(or 4)-monophosphatase
VTPKLIAHDASVQLPLAGEVARRAGEDQNGEVQHTDLSAALATAEDLALGAGRLQVSQRATLTVRGSKAHANDLVSDVDLASERLIVDGLRAAFPADGLLAEEGSSSAGTSNRRWIIDPLDGTRNYITHAGPWSVCIALQDGADTVLAVVHDPALQETFTAVRGAGAALNGQPLGASDCSRLAEAIAGLSFDPSPETKRAMAKIVSALLPVVGDIRRIPAGLHLAYLAAGRFDAGLLIHTKLWDVAAGLLVAAEAGVVLSGPGGTPTPELILAAAPAVWPEFSAAAAAALPRPS